MSPLVSPWALSPGTSLSFSRPSSSALPSSPAMPSS
ncbi:hypothetical protein BN1708_018014 [Verticillium longisporum]|uniref:Uncharacterized protein n=1 Tax=Verticillium longisporum TaxID=100787 RepID=A0A0G4LM93_VERLO|nr:hypothetical protein BN1708_018014 [Verticillium longisporum]